jgi:glycosyltransferase involved in cell wall biosynthesis
VPTRFTQASIAAVSPIPVRKITYPFYWSETDSIADRAGLGLKDSTYVFLFNFDFLSTSHRKNPQGVIEAFRKAFRPDEDVMLILKSINWEHDREGRELLTRRGEGLKIIFIDSHLPGAQVNALFASIDCYISLHRSEGLGLGMAQAMYLGKPVIGTGYSGNLEFMNRENSLLVNYKLVTMEETSGPYEKGSFWAQPDTTHAAELMRWVYEHRDESAALGKRAALDIRQSLSPERTKREILARVQELEDGRWDGCTRSIRLDC